MPEPLRGLPLLCLLFALGLPPGAAAQTLYRWTDANGVVHYSERLPTEATGKATAQLNRHGTLIKRHAAALTPEEIAAQEAAAREAESALARAREEERRNEALLATYASVQDLDEARERALLQNQEALDQAQHQLEQAQLRRAELEQQTRGLDDTALPARLARQLAANATELQQARELLATRQEAALSIAQRFDADKRRYLQLTREGGGNPRFSSMDSAVH